MPATPATTRSRTRSRTRAATRATACAHRLAAALALTTCAVILSACAGRATNANSAASSSAASISEADLHAQDQHTLDQLAALLVGSFSSAAQAQQNPAFREIELHMAAIWPDAAGTNTPAHRWLYVEQAMAQAPNRPYRQRVYRLSVIRSPQADGTTLRGVRSEVWELPGDPLRFAGAWRDPVPLADIGPESLALKDGCDVFLLPRPDGTWYGSTLGTACPSSLAGSSYATSIVEITPQGLLTLDRGFDAAHTQVWGSDKGPYDFRRK
jgi:hypothetical protein